MSIPGEEGETPASDEIWLAVGDDEGEDKFLSSDSEDHLSLSTDKLSTAATMDGHTAEADRRTSFECLLGDAASAADAADVAEITARLQNLLAGELMPIQVSFRLLVFLCMKL